MGRPSGGELVQMPCMVCTGTGSTPCTGCGGAGGTFLSKSRLRYDRTLEFYQERQPCRICFGTGRITCLSCKGVGWTLQSRTAGTEPRAPLANTVPRASTLPSAVAIPEQWLELQRGFMTLNDATLFANSELWSPESWNVSSQSKSATSVAEFKVLAGRAGELLPRTSSVWSQVIASSLVSIINTTDSVDRWLRFLRGDRGGDVGAIYNLTFVSAQACAYCGGSSSVDSVR